ncbi:MAG: pilus assembly protein PilC [Ilumatobacteraceae bacterium]|nr:pilus assembly protein PilC [Ilumatobacteraceae bacterium]
MTAETTSATRFAWRRRRAQPIEPEERAAIAALEISATFEIDGVSAAPRRKKSKSARKPMFSIGKTVKPDVIMAFSRQLASFLEAGISVLDGLETVAQETSSGPMRRVVGEIRMSILRGTSFVDAVAAHPTVFPAYYRAMLVSAEYTGELDTVLAQLASYLERDIAARRQVRSAMTYPTVVFFVAIAAMIVMSVFVLPKFTGLYRSLGADLPLPTRMLLGFTDFMTGYWPALLSAVALAALIGYIVAGGARGKGRRDLIAMNVPMVGTLFHLISLERFCRVLAALASAGVPLPEAIGVSADSTNNSIFQARMVIVRNTIVRGSGVYEPMAASGLFPLAARQMIQVGERTGSLGSQLGKAAAFYEREVTFSIKRATELFEPMVILVVGLIVGFVAVAQVSAMYSIFGQVK